ncbi:MAG: protease PrsW [Blastocatellia bacterium]|jgi:RsiW-degrading membrane proteinase PrsW (M82 family)|nr:protease PrsW [Blastocatellia bacterium]
MNNAFSPNAARTPIRPVIRSSGHQSAFKIILAVFAVLVASLLGVITLALIGSETGAPELVIGLICATLPVPVYVMILLWIDRYESEPLWMLATAFFWGALVAVFIAFIFNSSIQIMAAIATHSQEIGQNVGAVISAPIVEESSKAFILLVLFLWKRDEFDGIVDGVVYAGMVGLGFAMTENILYYGRALHEGQDTLKVLIVLRGIASPFAHPLFTGMTGIGLGWSRQSNNGFIKLVAPVVGFMLAILLHATWNASATYGGAAGFFAVYFGIMGPALIVTLMVVFFSLRREGRIVRQFLESDFQTGFFDKDEYEKLCTIRGRMGMSWTALTRHGLSPWRMRKQCNQMASELAFHRSRVARGFVRDPHLAQERENEYLFRLQELRQKLGYLQKGRG